MHFLGKTLLVSMRLRAYESRVNFDCIFLFLCSDYFQGENSREGPQTHLFQLDLRVDLDIADLTVEGSVLGRGLWFPRSGRPQPRISFDGAQSTSGLQNCLVLSTWSPQRAGG